MKTYAHSLAAAALALGGLFVSMPRAEAATPPWCDPVYANGWTPVVGQVTDAVAPMARPAKGAAYADPAYGACVVRATDHAAEPPSSFARNDYSRRQAFNADASQFLVFALNGYWHLYDANTLAHVMQLPGLAGDAEPQWHPTDPRSLYYVPNNGGTKLMKLDVATGAITTAADFTGKLPWPDVAHVWTKSEGSPSADGRYWCFQAEDAAFNTRGVFTFDLQTGAVLGTRATTVRPDHVSMSPSGRWCMVSNLVEGGGTVAWNLGFTQSRVLHRTSEHSDLALGADGHDYYVAVDYQSNAGELFMLDVDTGVRTALFPTYVGGTATAYHVSGKAHARPGWVLVSTYANDDATQWLHEKVFALELAPNPRIVNLAQHHVQYAGYWTEPHASVSRDFTRVLFNSNWGTASDTDVDAYLVALPPEALTGDVPPAGGGSEPPPIEPAPEPDPTPEPVPAPAGDPASCDPIYAGGFTPRTGVLVDPVASIARPAKGVAFADAAYGACVVRATDHAAEAPSGFARNDYARRQAFNADDTRFLVYAQDGHWHLYDANTLAHVETLPGLAADAEPQWHPSDPNRLWYVPTNGGTKLLELDVAAGTTRTAADFSLKLPWANIAHVWTRSEGSPSADGRYWCFMAEEASFRTRGVFTWDLQRNRLLGSRSLSVRPDHVSMSPSGNWCVVSSLADGGGTVAWSRNFKQQRKLHHTSEHSDLVRGANGHDWYVAVDYQSARGDLFAFDLDANTKTVLFPTYVNGTATAYHVSGKAHAKAGWILVSTYANASASQWLHEKLFAVKLEANPRVVNLAQHHTTYQGYWTEPHASVNRDFTKILFNSNWGAASETDVDTYYVRLPATALD